MKLTSCCRKCGQPIHQWEPGQQWYHDEIDIIEWFDYWQKNGENVCDAEPTETIHR